jgi:hypothetical protein
MPPLVQPLAIGEADDLVPQLPNRHSQLRQVGPDMRSRLDRVAVAQRPGRASAPIVPIQPIVVIHPPGRAGRGRWGCCGGRFVALGLVVTFVDDVLNAGGLYPYLSSLARIDAGKMIG